ACRMDHMNRHLRHSAGCHAEGIAGDQLIAARICEAKSIRNQVCAVGRAEQRSVLKQYSILAPPIGKWSLSGSDKSAKIRRRWNASELNLQLSGHNRRWLPFVTANGRRICPRLAVNVRATYDIGAGSTTRRCRRDMRPIGEKLRININVARPRGQGIAVAIAKGATVIIGRARS